MSQYKVLTLSCFFLSIYLSAFMCISLSVCLSVCLYVCPSVFIRVCIHLPAYVVFYSLLFLFLCDTTNECFQAYNSIQLQFAAWNNKCHQFCLQYNKHTNLITCSNCLLQAWIFLLVNLMFIGPCIIAIVDEWKTNLMSLVILFHLLCAQHVSDINISTKYQTNNEKYHTQTNTMVTKA